MDSYRWYRRRLDLNIDIDRTICRYEYRYREGEKKMEEGGKIIRQLHM